jgi:hypothetical protein
VYIVLTRIKSDVQFGDSLNLLVYSIGRLLNVIFILPAHTVEGPSFSIFLSSLLGGHRVLG